MKSVFMKRSSFLEKLLSNSPNFFKKNSNVVISRDLHKSFATKQITILFLSSECFQKNVYDRVDFWKGCMKTTVSNI